jgi:hypothetical protein
MTVKFPKTLGECIDQLYELRAKRLAGQKAVDLVKAEEAEYENHILATFSKSDLRGAKGDLATAGVKRTTVYNITDWDLYTKWIDANQAWDCLQKRLASTAIAARFDNGEEIPGVESFEKVSLSLTKAS